MSLFMTRYRNAKKVVGQIRRGEWWPRFNPYTHCHLVATRGGLELWIGNGPFFCDIRIDGQPAFGLVWRHYVWWAAARDMVIAADSSVIPIKRRIEL